VCPVRGSVTWKVSADESWISQGTFNVPQNTARWKRTADSGCEHFPYGLNDCPTIDLRILDGAGDDYQFRWFRDSN